MVPESSMAMNGLKTRNLKTMSAIDEVKTCGPSVY
jgi:hypothetical protein